MYKVHVDDKKFCSHLKSGSILTWSGNPPLTVGQKVGIAFGVILVIALLIVIAVLLFMYKKKPYSNVARRMKTMANVLPEKWHRKELEDNELYVSNDAYIMKSKEPQYGCSKVTNECKQTPGFQVEASDVKILENIASGRFADVSKGVLQQGGKSIDVAVKALKKNIMDRDDEIMRSKILFMASQVKPHANILKFYGAFQDDNNYPTMLLELCDLPLKDWLSSINSISTSELDNMLNFSIQIADGVKHLHDSKIIHRKLAARNVLLKVTRHGYEAKLIGFGPSRDDSSDSNDSVVPMKWCAPETLATLDCRKPTYDEKTDAWSYGITVWEIYTGGQSPFDEYRSTQIKDVLMKGVRPDCPEECPKDIYDQIMMKCWDPTPGRRPSFKSIYNGLLGYRNGAQGIQPGYYGKPTVVENNMAGYYDGN
ncbi:hypothetical protein HELRODRAFT_168474 [Helobdella robusta]|uniref:Protein kinase domain-containing protein n=1 Tax=Helobdella robusta TaxID=6412 RepID=T1F0M2_HELRO|nr:hypothetical protein HELRODRAFT_168474 [Helobdella robusta]ESO09485.1 hypothetical protein HELRODRAFT_168474 [Helobdella robusta]